jgi:hypothetical protein
MKMSGTKLASEGKQAGRAGGAAKKRPPAELSRLVDRFCMGRLRSRLGRAAPTSLTALLESRGVGIEMEDLLLSTVEAMLALPETRRIEPGKVLTGQELAILKRGGFETELPEKGHDALSRGIAEYSSLIATSLTAPEAAEHLDVNPSRIRQRLKARTLYGFKLGDDWRLPKFQFADRRLVPGIEGVLSELPRDLHPVAVATWFITPDPDLSHESSDRPMTPLEWLRSGYDPKAVAALAVHL